MANVWYKASMKKPKPFFNVLAWVDFGTFKNYAICFYDPELDEWRFRDEKFKVMMWRPLPHRPKEGIEDEFRKYD